jgi:hypothetical protein
MPLPRAIDRAPNNINLAPESSENPKMRTAVRPAAVLILEI